MVRGWISTQALQEGCVDATAIEADAVTTAKIADAAITIGKLDSTLIGYLLPVGRIDYSGMDYCKIG